MCHFQAFWVGSKPVRSNFLHIFGVRKKIKKKNFQEKSVFIGKNRFFSGKNRFLSEKSAIFRRFFFSDFSTAKSFLGPPKSDFSPKNQPISKIFLSLGTGKREVPLSGTAQS